MAKDQRWELVVKIEYLDAWKIKAKQGLKGKI